MAPSVMVLALSIAVTSAFGHPALVVERLHPGRVRMARDRDGGVVAYVLAAGREFVIAGRRVEFDPPSGWLTVIGTESAPAVLSELSEVRGRLARGSRVRVNLSAGWVEVRGHPAPAP